MRFDLFACGVVVCVLVAPQLQVSAEEEKPQQPSLGMQTNWRPCSDELPNPHVSVDIEVYSPECPAVNGTDSICLLKKGSPANLIVRFRPNVTIPNLERVIIARVPAALDKKIEVPYGPPISPCSNSSLVATDGTECVDGGVEAGKWYTYSSSFDVLQSFPAVQDLETRHILRQKNPKHKKLRMYKKHPGPTVYCVVVQRIFVE